VRRCRPPHPVPATILRAWLLHGDHTKALHALSTARRTSDRPSIT
jgi:hypothetical protein